MALMPSVLLLQQQGKLQRESAYQFMKAVDHMLEVGVGLRAWLVEAPFAAIGC